MADFLDKNELRNDTSSRFLENDQNSSSYLDEGGTGMNRQHFIKGRRSSKISMMNAKHKTSLSLSRFTGNQSLSGLRGKFGRNKSLLNYKDSKQDFDTKHKHTMAEIISSVTKCLKIREAVEDQYINEDKLKLLNKENKVLRTNVKKLNEYLSSFLTHVKEFKQKTHSSMSYKYGSHGKLKKNRDEKLKAQDQETQNYSKMLKNLREEHLKTKNRVFQVQDPRYILNLKKEVKKTKEKIREMTSENTNLKAQEFSTNKKLDQVLHQGKNDAMNKISQLLKDLMALEERKSKYDKKIEFQIKTEIDIDEEIQNSKARANEIEQKARQEGLLDQKDDQYSPLYSPERVKAMKQKIEKHSLSAIHRKFFTKIIKQKKKLQGILSNYNDNVIMHRTMLSKDTTLSIDINTSEEYLTNKSQEVLQVDKHPLIEKINKSLSSLKKSLPQITNKLKWDKPIWHNKQKLRGFKRTNKSKRMFHSEDSRHHQNTRNGAVNNEYDDEPQSYKTIANKDRAR
ncbi:unnamed protein product [Moneuplotes crassus]|uniref:Uncharacterized protein n=1 Tax=Euplotes crassus TaxID=5936 RepID=A0AAD1X2R5_EUPCR|nr:unnamed protein product [Moneuplotes crassus]